MSRPKITDAARAITPERAARLHSLLHLIAAEPQRRATLLDRLKLDVRGFYRDLEAIRGLGLTVTLSQNGYTLEGTLAAALDRLPLPDPHLTLAEARQLCTGRTVAHRRLKAWLEGIVGPPPSRKRAT